MLFTVHWVTGWKDNKAAWTFEVRDHQAPQPINTSMCLTANTKALNMAWFRWLRSRSHTYLNSTWECPSKQPPLPTLCRSIIGEYIKRQEVIRPRPTLGFSGRHQSGHLSSGWSVSKYFRAASCWKMQTNWRLAGKPGIEICKETRPSLP